jgi:hypothetical protein
MANIFAPLTPAERAIGTTPAKPKPVPIVPVPEDAPACTWRHPRHGKPVATWAYHDADGRLVAYAARVEYRGADGKPNKDVLPLTCCRVGQANGLERYGWRACGVPAPRPLYHLPELLAAAEAPVIVTEGEMKADVVPSLFPGHVGTTSLGGADAAKLSDWTPLARRNVIIWPDHDEPGRGYAHDVAVLATAAGVPSVAIVAVPAEWPEGWDIADALPEGVAPDTLAQLLQSAIPWTPAAAAPNEPGDRVDATAEIARLAGLPLLQYDHEREAAAKGLGCRTSTLDHLVAKHRGESAGAPGGQGRPLDMHEPEPWPEPVHGATLLAGLAVAIRRHVVLGTAEAEAVALWVIAAHAFDAWRIFPRVFVTAPEKQCGKTTLMDVLWFLVPKPLKAGSVTAATIFRVIELARPTLLLDEADHYRDAEELRAVINSGHSRNGNVIRNVPAGDGWEVRQFSTWAPIALAAIGHVWATVEDRSIRIGLRRRRPDELIEPLRLARAGELEDLARKAARWVADHAAELAAADPEMPEGIVNRAADNWHPLLAVADLAGGAWPERARRAAAELSSEGDDQTSIRAALLADIRAAFAAKGVDRQSSDELAAYLGSLDDRPWPDYRGGKPISKTQVARLLKPIGVSSGTIRLPDNTTPEGYYLTAFRDAFSRYLPAENATTPQRSVPVALGAFQNATSGNGVAFQNCENPSVSTDCGVVADENPPAAGDGDSNGYDRDPRRRHGRSDAAAPGARGRARRRRRGERQTGDPRRGPR